MRFVLVILLVGGVWGFAAYRHSSPRPAAPAMPAVVSEPAPPPLSLEERAAAAQGTTLPPEARRPYPQPPAEEALERVETTGSAPVASAYRCDGRTRCPQMHSCQEATWFLQNCPGTKMDGDRDGQPCEEQWCGQR